MPRYFDFEVTLVRRACAAGEVLPGKMFIVDRSPRTPRWIINFPTKRHWRDTSRLDDVLVDLTEQILVFAPQTSRTA